MLYNRQSSIPKGFCRGGHNQVHLTIMPFYRLGTIDDLAVNQDQLASIIGQVIMASIEMYLLIGLVHADLIPSNVAIETDTSDKMLYLYLDNEYEIRLRRSSLRSPCAYF